MSQMTWALLEHEMVGQLGGVYTVLFVSCWTYMLLALLLACMHTR